MNIKKILASALTLSMLCGGAAMAQSNKITESTETNKITESTETNKITESTETKLTATVASGYIIYIQPTLNLKYGAQSTALPVQLLEMHLNTAEYNALRVELGNVYGTLKNENNDTIYFEVNNGEEGGRILTFTTIGTKNYYVKVTENAWKTAPAGNYNDATVTIDVTPVKVEK